MSLRTLAACALLVAAIGCSEKPKPGPSVDATAPADPDALLPANARAALAKPAGATEADRNVAVAQDVVRRDMAKLDAWVALGHAWLRKARESDDDAFETNADACASVVLARDPDHAPAADLRAHVLLSRREYAEARKLAERITARHPTDASAWANLTSALIELGHYESANDAAQKLLELGPSVAAHRRMSRLQWLAGHVARAKESIGKALAEGTNGDPPELAASFVDSGMIAWHAGDYDAADQSFDRALEKHADFAPALAGKGRVAMAKKEWTRAADFFARAYAKHRSVEAAWLLGDAREAAGDAKGAADAYALVERNRAKDPVTYSLFLSTRNERISEAVEIVSEEHKKTVDVYTEDALAWALRRAGMIAPAKTAMGRARSRHTPDALIMFHEGAIRIAAGDVKKGKEVVARALATNRAFDWRSAKEARDLVVH